MKALGQFSGLDPSVVTGNQRVAGNLTGAVDVDTTMRDYASGVTVDSFDATGRVDLANSTIHGLAIDTAVIDGTYANREGHLTQAAIAGPDLKVTAQGDIALNDTGASNLTAHLESPAARTDWRDHRPAAQGRGGRRCDRDRQRQGAEGCRHAAGQQHRLRQQRSAQPE